MYMAENGSDKDNSKSFLTKYKMSSIPRNISIYFKLFFISLTLYQYILSNTFVIWEVLIPV